MVGMQGGVNESTNAQRLDILGQVRAYSPQDSVAPSLGEEMVPSSLEFTGLSGRPWYFKGF